MKNLIFSVIIAIVISGCANGPDTLTIKTDDIEIRAGATRPSQAFCLWNDPYLVFTDIDDAYVMLVNDRNGDMYDADATTPTVTTTYADAAIALTQDAQNTEWACGTLPAMDDTVELILCVYENATPTLGDPIKAAYYIDPITGGTYTDTNPLTGNRVRVD